MRANPSRRAMQAGRSCSAGSVVGEHPGHHLGVHPGRRCRSATSVRPDGRHEPDGRPAPQLERAGVYAKNAELVDRQLAGGDHAAEHGGRVLALTLPDSFASGSTSAAGSFSTSSGLGQAWPCRTRTSWPSCRPVRAGEMDRLAQSPTDRWAHRQLGRVLRPSGQPARRPLVGSGSPRSPQLRATTAWDALADVVVADELMTVHRQAGQGPGRRLLGAAGIGLAGSPGPGRRLGRRGPPRHDRLLLLLHLDDGGGGPRAVHSSPSKKRCTFTEVPARLYGLRDRGRMAPGTGPTWWS